MCPIYTIRVYLLLINSVSTIDSVCGGNLLLLSSHLLKCIEEEASFCGILALIKPIPPLCIIGELDEDPYDDPDDPGDDHPLPL
ncbi:hypothetical protein H5410_004791 [Solanum commersonii]|uniref:Secreted protein n=1 Tax=Solanum commersonii TaxID=4109 RepID=A0A9J6A4T6_SOLCO|nr:hypothetical protein H5410_004791 [Solanum commersonii]